jgi:hypothetical protein
MDEGTVRRELLEPRLSLEQRKERAIHALINNKPDITKVSRSSILDQASGALLGIC